MSAKKWLVISGALALGATGAIAASSDVGRDSPSLGPGVQLQLADPQTTSSGADAQSLGGVAGDADWLSPAGGGGSLDSPDSPPARHVSPRAAAQTPPPGPQAEGRAPAVTVAPQSADSPDSPDSPASVDSPDSADSADSADSPDSPDSPDSAD